MIENPSSQKYEYPHQKGEVTDQGLRRDVEEQPEAYGLMLPYIDAYLSKKNGDESDKIENGDTYTAETAEAIEAMQRDVAIEIGAGPNSPDAVGATDYLLIRELEESIKTGESTNERIALAPFVAGALEADGQRVSSDENPVFTLENEGNSQVVTDSISNFIAIDAHLPNTGHSVGEVLARELESQTKENRERFIVTDPSMQAALDALAKTENMDDPTTTGYMHSLSKFVNDCRDVDWDDVPTRDLDVLMEGLKVFDTKEKLYNDTKQDYNYSTALQTLNSVMPAESFKRLYDSNNPRSKESINSVLESTELTDKTFPDVAELLLKTYGSRKELANVADGVDPLVDKLRNSDFKVDLAIGLIEPMPENLKDTESLAKHDHSMIEQSKDILENKLKLPHSFVQKYGVAIYGRLLSPPSHMRELGYINGEMLAERLSRVKESVNAVGPDTIVRLHEQLGLVNIDNYAPEDLQSLVKLLDGNQEYIKQLQNGDVTVAFADAYGDHNGALSQTFDAYRRDNGKTLMFEISSPSDLYRRMIMLKKLGIKPSTLAVSAHGRPGGTDFGNKTGGDFGVVSSEMVSSVYNDRRSFNLADARLDRIAGDEFMQVSKGIDDGLDVTGRRRIIINSCSSDVEFNAGVPSTAETVARTVGRDDVDVYGASDTMYFQDKDGDISFLGMKDSNSKVATEQIGQKISIKNRNGFVTRLREKLGVGNMVTIDGRRLDKRRNGALRIKRTKVNKVYSNNMNTFPRIAV
ncbi:MAG: hypothetical protein WAW80_02385 [Candidatus Saccharimonadales bacterium]